jgi:hypothetical protein
MRHAFFRSSLATIMSSKRLASALSASLFVAACDPTTAVQSDARGDAGRPTPDAAAVDCTGRPTETPSPRGELSGVFDAARNRLVMVGGNTAAPVNCMPMYNLIDEMWAFHLDCNNWERLTPEGGPGIRARQSTTLDTTHNRMVLFGGRQRMSGGFGSYVNFNDVWTFDLASDTWTQLVTTGTAPSTRSSAIIQYDAPRHRVILFGGNSSTSGLTLTGLGDTWALDMETGAWTQLEIDGPPARLFHASTHVTTASEDSLYVFGGTPNFDGPFMNDTYVFDLASNTWSLVETSGDVPVERFGAEAFYDADHHRMLIAFGHDGTNLGNRNDVYALDLATRVWSRVRPGDTYDNAASGMCMFPADFTAPEEGAPERRYSFVAVQSETRAFVFGGKTDCGIVNDVVGFDFASDAWTPIRTATGGEACNRTGRVGCTTLCY